MYEANHPPRQHRHRPDFRSDDLCNDVHELEQIDCEVVKGQSVEEQVQHFGFLARPLVTPI